MKPLHLRTTIVVAFLLILIVPAHAAVINAVANGDWDDPTTWDSNPSIPGAGDEVHINGFTVDVDANADCFSLDVYSGSSLRFMANVGLDINGGNITVYSGGSIDRNSTTAHLDFDNSATDSVIVESTGTITIEDIQINAAVNLLLFGAGSITLSDDLLFQTSKATVTNNMSGSLNLTGANSSSVWFTTLSDTCTFINLQTMTVSRYLYIESAGNTVTNSGSIDFNNTAFGIFITNGDGDGTTINNSGTIHVAGNVTLGNADMDFNNTGTLDVDGDFGTISSNTNLYNFAGATLRWAGTAYGGMRLFTHYSGSSVIYDRASGTQEIFNPQDRFWNFSTEGGTKNLVDVFAISGDLTISSPVTVPHGARGFTLDSSSTVTLASGASMTESGGTGTLNFAAGKTHALVVNDATTGLSWTDIEVETNATLTISGTGKISLNGDILLQGDKASATNNLTDTIAITTGLAITTGSDSCTYVNNGIMTIGQDVFFGTNVGNTVTNNGTMLIGDDITLNGLSNTFSSGASSTTTVTDDLFLLGDSLNVIDNQGAMTADRLDFQTVACTVSNGGTLTMAQGLRILNNGDDRNAITNQSGGTITFNGNLDLQDADFTVNNSGVFDLNGNFTNNLGTEAYNNLSGGDFRFSGTIRDGATIYLSASNNTFTFDHTGGQTVFTPADGSYWHLTCAGSGDKDPLAALDINGNLSISGTAVLDASVNGGIDLNVAGNWTNTSTAGDPFVQSTQTVTLDGSSAQTISVANGEEWYQLVVNNTSGGILLDTGRVTVSNSVTLTSGIITGSDSNFFILNDNISLTGGSNASHFDGRLRKIGDDAFTFPVGDSAVYRPITISAPANATDAFDGRYFNLNPNDSYSILSKDLSLNNISQVEYWTLDRATGSSNVNVTLSWNAESAVSDLADLRVARWNGSQWTNHGNGGTTGNTTAGTVATSSAVTNFSPFALASTSNNNPLPIELLSFEAQLNAQGETELTWTTATEVNNDYFTVERSPDGKQVQSLLDVPGAGTSNELIHYVAHDRFPLSGTSYYRLRQTDFNGQSMVSEWRAIDHLESEPWTVYPNPTVQGEGIWLQHPVNLSGTAALRLTDGSGRVLRERSLQLTPGPIHVDDLLDAGVYWLSVATPTAEWHQLVVVR